MITMQVAGAANPETTASSIHGQKLTTGVGFWDNAAANPPPPEQDGFWANRSSKLFNPMVHTQPTTLGASDFAARLAGAGPEDEAHRRMSQHARSVLSATALTHSDKNAINNQHSTVAPTTHGGGHGLVHVGGNQGLGDVRVATLAARVPRISWDALDWAQNDQTNNPRGQTRIQFLEEALATEKLKCPDTADGGHRSGVHPGGHLPMRDTLGKGAMLGNKEDISMDNPTWKLKDGTEKAYDTAAENHTKRRQRGVRPGSEQSPAGSGFHHVSPRETDRRGLPRRRTPASRGQSRRSSGAQEDWAQRMALASQQEKESRRDSRARSSKTWKEAPGPGNTVPPQLDLRYGQAPGGARALPEPEHPTGAQKTLVQRLGYTSGPSERASLGKAPGGHSGTRSTGFAVSHLHALEKGSHFDRTLDMKNVDDWMHELCDGRSSTLGQPTAQKGHRSSTGGVARGSGTRVKPNRPALPTRELQRRQAVAEGSPRSLRAGELAFPAPHYNIREVQSDSSLNPQVGSALKNLHSVGGRHEGSYNTSANKPTSRSREWRVQRAEGKGLNQQGVLSKDTSVLYEPDLRDPSRRHGKGM